MNELTHLDNYVARPGIAPGAGVLSYEMIDKLEAVLNAPAIQGGFFDGMYRIPVSDDMQISGSRDLIKAYITYSRCVHEGVEQWHARQDAVRREMTVMGDTILPLGAEVIMDVEPHRDAVVRISAVSEGYLGRPYYYVIFRREDGSYPMGTEILEFENSAYVYARHLRDYGLTILQGKINAA